ncbi:hypothetical protein XANCAGTX0491_004452 [Xanthoria calcicola]
MEATLRKEPRLALSVASSQTLSLDLWKGFSDPVSINVLSAESPLDGELPPLIEYISACLDWHKVPSLWAFTTGPLAMWDQSGKQISIKSHVTSDFESLDRGSLQYLRGERVNSYELGRMSRILLKALRSKLKPGISYCLGFKERSYPMRAVQSDSGFGRLRPGADDCWVDVACDSRRAWFEVVAGKEIPRFQAALSTYKTSRCCGAYPVHWVTIKITSLDKRPIAVKMPDPNFEMNHGGLSQWLYVHDPSKPSVSYPLRWEDEGRQQTWQRNKEECLRTCPKALTFQRGTSWTFRFEAPAKGWSDRPNVESDLDIKILADQSGFSTWKYLDEDLGPEEAPDQWPSNGRIEFEPILDGWDEIEEMLEGEQPLPFFSLPIELRQMIYDYLKYGEGAGLAKFTRWDELQEL